MKNTVLLAVLTVSFLTPSAYPMAQWDRANRPELMDNKYERNFSKLPKSGKLKTLPWSDDYWGTYHGGITYRWHQKVRVESEKWSYKLENSDKINTPINDLSPAEKYDLFLGNTDFPLTKYERERTKIMQTIPGSPEYKADFKIPEWEGLCHAWAPATLHYKNPEPITVIGKKGHKISFGSSDIKALLTYHLHLNQSPRNYFLGSRCNLDFKELEKKFKAKEITKKEMEDQMNSAECKDTNAGAFHMVLTNQIGLMNEGFVADVTRDQEVWNQPIYGFEVKILGTKNGATEGAAPGTVKEITVLTKMLFVQEIEQTYELVNKPFYISSAEYQYRVELNADGEIVGGEWISFERPDFIWKNIPAKFQGYFKDLDGLYKKSVQYLAPKRFTEVVKVKMKKAGKLSLIKKEFIKDLKAEVAETKLRIEAERIAAENRRLEEIRAMEAKAKAERIAKKVALLKQEARKNFITSKFIDGAREDVRNAHIEKALESAKKQLTTSFLVNKFIKDVKGEVRDSHIKTALDSSSKKLHNTYLANKFINGMILDKNITKVKKASKPTILAGIFVREVGSDARETRKIKEEHKDAALASIKAEATRKFLEKKFISEVSKDAVLSRRIKEVNKRNALKAADLFATQNFYGKKFITEVSKYSKETRRIKEEHKNAAKKEVLSDARVSLIKKTFTKEIEKVVKQNMLNKELLSAIEAKNLVKIQSLLKAGANPSESDSTTGLTPLMVASKVGNIDIIKALLKVLDKKAINAVDKDGRNALILAIIAPGERPDRHTREIVRELLDREIDVNQKDITGTTALGYVTSGQYKSKLIAWALKDKGAKI